jgi:hypothetical protein
MKSYLTLTALTIIAILLATGPVGTVLMMVTLGINALPALLLSNIWLYATLLLPLYWTTRSPRAPNWAIPIVAFLTLAALFAPLLGATLLKWKLAAIARDNTPGGFAGPTQHFETYEYLTKPWSQLNRSTLRRDGDSDNYRVNCNLFCSSLIATVSPNSVRVVPIEPNGTARPDLARQFGSNRAVDCTYKNLCTTDTVTRVDVATKPVRGLFYGMEGVRRRIVSVGAPLTGDKMQPINHASAHRRTTWSSAWSISFPLRVTLNHGASGKLSPPSIELAVNNFPSKKLTVSELSDEIDAALAVPRRHNETKTYLLGADAPSSGAPSVKVARALLADGGSDGKDTLCVTNSKIIRDIAGDINRHLKASLINFTVTQCQTGASQASGCNWVVTEKEENVLKQGTDWKLIKALHRAGLRADAQRWRARLRKSDSPDTFNPDTCASW